MENNDFDRIVDLISVPESQGKGCVQQIPALQTNSWDLELIESSVYETIDEYYEADMLTYKDSSALCGDLRFITNSPEMCDVTFLVGKSKVPVYGVKAILATRSRVFYRMIYSKHTHDSSLAKSSKKLSLLSRVKKLAKPKRSSGRKSLVLRIPEFDAKSFRPVIAFLHSGSIHITQENVVGLMNAADTYGLDDLRSACCDYVRKSITMKGVLPLLTSAESYSHFKWTKIISLEIIDFIRKKAQDILRLKDFEAISQQNVMLILSTRGLRATEEAKWDAALRWCRRRCERHDDKQFRKTLALVTSSLDFCDIPLAKLRSDVQPLGIVPDDIINKAISYQSSARLVIGQALEPTATHNRRLSKQKASSGLRTKKTTRRQSSAPLFPILPLASSTFNCSRQIYLNHSDSGYVLSTENCSFQSKL